MDAAAAEDADEVAIRMVTDEDYPDDSKIDSDYNRIDAARDAQEDANDEGKPHPNTNVPPPMTGLTSFGISIRVGLIAKKSSTETQDTTSKNSQASNGHPSLSGSNDRPLTRSGSNDARNYTTKRKDSDGTRNARTPSKNQGYVQPCSFTYTTGKFSTNRLMNAWNYDSVISKHAYNSYTR
jgi:hypothetical protein